jgi:hypothetical protein
MMVAVGKGVVLLPAPKMIETVHPTPPTETSAKGTG